MAFNYPPSQKAANFSWRMNEERVSAEAGALVPPTSVGGAPQKQPRIAWISPDFDTGIDGVI
jgi:hypothetical protein